MKHARASGGRWRWGGVAAVVASACGAPPPPPARPVIENHPRAPVVEAPRTGDALLAWPVAPLSAAQIAAVTGCGVGKLAAQRYPETVTLAQLPGAFDVATPCDQAALAAACVPRLAGGAAPPPACLDAYRAVVRANPAFAFSSALVGGYFGRVPLVAPPVAGHAVVGVVLDYAWSGLGDEVAWTLTVRDATTHPTVAVTGASAKPIASTPAALPAAIAELGRALPSFLPIAGPLEAVDCTDNYPEWSATLTFDDGRTLALSTHRSNLLGLGGPWQLTLDGTTYLQLAPDLTRAVAHVLKVLDLPVGQPQGMFCRGYDIEAAVLHPTRTP